MDLEPELTELARRTLAEDVGPGDLSAALLAPRPACGVLVCREAAMLCGAAWFERVMQLTDESIRCDWQFKDGEWLDPDATVCEVRGPAPALATAERAALNLLQTLSATATCTARHVQALSGTRCTLLDTRKTLPGMRHAQKYAVRVGGGTNHRMGLFDAVMLKENHLTALGGIAPAMRAAKKAAAGGRLIVEVEDLAQLEAALEAGAQWLLLDNFSLKNARAAVELTAGRAKLEFSGAAELADLPAIAATGVDYVSVGALTKHVRAVDFSFRLTMAA